MMKILLPLLLVILSSYLSIHNSSAQVITAETGGASRSAGIVKKGQLTIEAESSYFRDFDERKSYRYNLGASLLRYGIKEDLLELRFFTNGLIIQEEAVGFDNINLGFKTKLLGENKYIPEINLITDFVTPIGDRDLRSDGFSHIYNFVIAKNFKHGFSGIINFGPAFLADETELPYVFGLGYNITPQTTIFAETFGSFGLSNNLDHRVGFDFGFTHALTENLVTSATSFWGLNNATDDFGINLGLAYKLF